MYIRPLTAFATSDLVSNIQSKKWHASNSQAAVWYSFLVYTMGISVID